MDEINTFDQDRIIKINVEEEMKSSYIDYSMSVIVARALPDVRDGFKPVHRRILYGMAGIGNTSDKPYKKCARVVGEVLGKFHPHGDSSVYGALVRMAQDWNMRYTLVDGQGNFGSVDGDSPAAMRYTECRLSKLGEHIMDDLEKDTVDMQNNFDDTQTEPTVMPTKIPNLLVNGGNGIAVGMATNIPTHNLGEVIDGCCAFIDNPEIDIDTLMQYIPAPDFPTGATIYGIQGVKDAYETGRGRIVIRAKAEIETGESHDKIVVTEIPYGVNKQQLIEYIADLVKEGKIDEAIETYEQNVKIGYPAHHAYKRLMVLYSKKHDKENELRITKLAVVKFPEELEYKKRLEKLTGTQPETKYPTTRVVFEGREVLGDVFESVIRNRVPEFDFYQSSTGERVQNDFLSFKRSLEPVYKIQQHFRSVLDAAEKFESEGEMEKACYNYEQLLFEKYYMPAPFDRLIKIYSKAHLRIAEKEVLIASIEHFKALKESRRKYVEQLADKYGAQAFLAQRISEGKKISYFNGVFELYNPFAIIEEWEKRLSKIDS